MEGISNRINIENYGPTQLPPPPPYTTVVYKIDENELDRIPPPSYSDVNNHPILYINNYPGPPLTDGVVQGTQDATLINQDTIVSKKIRIYLLLTGIITVLFGLIAVGMQIGILVTNSIIYYYYGFWGGALLIGIGISSVVLYNPRRRINYSKLFHSFFWQIALLAVVFSIGIVIILTDRCNDNATENDGTNNSCRNSYKLLNGFLIGTFGIALLQSIINAVVFGILKRQNPIIPNSFS